MLTPFDVANLNRSIQNVGDTFAEQRRERSANDFRRQQLQMEQQRLDVDKSFRAEQLQHERNMESSGVARLQLELKKLSQESVQNVFETISKHVADGSIAPEVGTQMIKGAASKIQQQNPDAFADDPLISMVSADDFALQDPRAANEPQSKEFQTADGRKVTAIYNPKTGQFHVPDFNSKTGADEHLANAARVAQQEADAETDPTAKTEKQTHADTLGALVKKRAGLTPPATKLVTQEKPIVDMTGAVTGTNTVKTTTTFTPPTTPARPAAKPAPTAPAAPSPTGQPSGAPDPRDVQWLQQSPTPARVQKFESKYGTGSAQQFVQPQ